MTEALTTYAMIGAGLGATAAIAWRLTQPAEEREAAIPLGFAVLLLWPAFAAAVAFAGIGIAARWIWAKARAMFGKTGA